jgi:hypothetical protein
MITELLDVVHVRSTVDGAPAVHRTRTLLPLASVPDTR